MSLNLGAGRPKSYATHKEYSLPEAGSPGGTVDGVSSGDRYFRMLLKESRVRNAYSRDRLRDVWRAGLGLRDETTIVGGRRMTRTVVDASKRRFDPFDFGIREVSRELLSGGFVDSMRNSKGSDGSSTALRDALAPVTASTQQDVNAYSIYIGGLIELHFLLGYQLPEFMGKAMVPVEPTDVRQTRIIGEANMNLPDKPTLEANEYPNQGILPRWVIRPPLVKYGQKASLTKEAVIFGLGGELLKAVEGGGMALGYLEEYWIAAMVQGRDIVAGTPGFVDGLTVNNYLYNAQPNDTPNATYQAAVGTGNSLKYNYQNQFSGKPLSNYKDLQNGDAKLALMREFETNYPILTTAKDLVVQPANIRDARITCHTDATPVNPGFATSGNPVMMMGGITGYANLKPMASAIWNKVLVDSGISQANADLYWHYGDVGKAFARAVIWDTKIIQANVLSSELVGSDIVGEWVYSWFQCPFVKEARHMLQFTN